MATPIVLDIINDAKEESDKRSIGMYVKVARMPSKAEVNGAGCKDSTSGTCPLWMVNYFDFDYSPNRTVVSGVEGYWTLSSYIKY